MTGNKAPPLKRIANWLQENPQFDVDPKWAELVKERGNLPHDLQKRLPSLDRKKGPGRPPILASPPTSQAAAAAAAAAAASLSSTASSLPTSLASNLPFSSLASINPTTLLSGLSMSNFDPKTNPLLLPFAAGMPNMNALSGMSGLSNMNFFANLASLGMTGALAGMDGNSLSGGDHTIGSNVASSTGSGTASGSTSNPNVKSSKNRKTDNASGSGGGSGIGGGGSSNNSKTPSVSTASSLSSSLPFFFQHPMLYTPLGLTGLNPFSLQSGSLPPTYDSLALLNGGLGITSSSSVNTTTASRHKTSTSGSGRSTMVTSSNVSSSPSTGQRQSSSSSRSATPHSQFQLPSEGHLLDSLTKSRSGDSKSNRSRDIDSSLRSLMSGMSPLSMHGFGGDGKKSKEQEILENLNSKFSTEMFARIPAQLSEERKTSLHTSTSDLMEKLLKRSAPLDHSSLSGERSSKRSKDSTATVVSSAPTMPVLPAMSKLFSNSNLTISSSDMNATPPFSAGMDLSNERKELNVSNESIAFSLTMTSASTPASSATPKTKVEPSKSLETIEESERLEEIRFPPAPQPPPSMEEQKYIEPEKSASPDPEVTDSPEEVEPLELKITSSGSDGGVGSAVEQSMSATSSVSSQHESVRSPSVEKEDVNGANKKRKPRNKKNPMIAPEEAIERKNLRSSAGRAAAVAAARAARAAAAVHDEQIDDKKDEDSATEL